MQYGAVSAVSDASITIADGESIGLIGPNGAGKTSTLSAIVGLVHASANRLELNGEDLLPLSAEQRLRRGISIVPQGRQLFPNLSVADNIRTGLWSKRVPRRRALDPALLELFPQLRSRMDQRAGSLSGGEQQLCAIARAMASRPKLLLLDEPSMGLAPKLVSSVVALLQQIAETSQMSMLVVEQGTAILARLTSRLLMCHAGRISGAVLAATTSQQSEFGRRYFGVDSIQHGGRI